MSIHYIKVSGTNETIKVNIDRIEEGGDVPDRVAAEVWILGLEIILNRGMSRITTDNHPDPEEFKAARVRQAEENLKRIREDNIRLRYTRPSRKITGEELCEAMRIARLQVKEELKCNGIRISHVSAREITAKAKELLGDHPETIEQARENVRKRREFASS